MPIKTQRSRISSLCSISLRVMVGIIVAVKTHKIRSFFFCLLTTFCTIKTSDGT